MPSQESLSAGAPSHTVRETGGAIAVGVVALLTSGLLPLLLGALAGEGRLSTAGIGQLGTAETLSIAASTGLAGLVLKPVRLRLIVVSASVALALADLASIGGEGLRLEAVRTLAGVPEGLLLWVTVGLIARSAVPERGAAVYLVALALAQVLFAVALSAWVLPAGGADGVFLLLGVTSVSGALLARAIPDRYESLSGEDSGSAGEGGLPPARGWIALVSALGVQAAAGAVGVYLVPLALQAGVRGDVAGWTVAAALGSEVVGALAAIALAGRVSYLPIVLLGAVALVAAWSVVLLHPPAWLFFLACGSGGFFVMLVTPFLVPMIARADPSRRAVLLFGGVQLLGGALGPLLASVVVEGERVRRVALLAIGLVTVSAGIAAALHRRVIAPSEPEAKAQT